MSAEYMGTLKKQLEADGIPEDEIKEFTTGVSNYYSKHIKPNFENYDFYTGDSMKENGM